MKLCRSLFSTLAAFSLLGVHAFAADNSDELVGYDKRREHRALPAPEQKQAHRDLAARVRGLAVDFDASLGSPKWVRSLEDDLTGSNGNGKGVSAATAARYAGDEHQALKAFLDEHRTLFGHGPEVLKNAVKTRDSLDSQTGVRMTAWQQQLDNVPVYGSIFIAHAGKARQLLSVSSIFLADLEGAANRGTPGRGGLLKKPPTTARRALQLAVPILGEEATNLVAKSAATGAELVQNFDVQPLPGDATARLVWFPVDRQTLRLCWQVELNRRRFNERFRVLVDVQTEEIVLWRKLTVDVQPVTYRVFTNDSPTHMRPGWSTPSAAQPPMLSPSLVTLAAVSSNASPLGWLNDGETILRGNNIDAALDRNGDDRPDVPRVGATVGPDGLRTFDYPFDASLPPTNYSAAASVQLFYWCNWMHDRLYDIGFVEGKGNFQKDNFGRGGLGNDWVVADAQDGSGFNNANFTPTVEGVPARIQMFIFSGPNPQHDGDLDAEVVLHEYTHGMSDRRVGHGVGISEFQTYGLAEGWSDFFAEAMLTTYEHPLDGNYPMGGYASYLFSGLQESYYYGIRRYPYSTSTNISPLMFQDIDTNQVSAYPGIPRSPVANGPASEVHRQGEVWCLMLWEVRAALLRRMHVTPENYRQANDFVMRLIADGMDKCPPNPNFVQAREGILMADRDINNGVGTNAPAIWSAFAKRGLGADAVAPDSGTTSGVIASTATPSFRVLAIAPATVDFNAPFHGPYLPQSNGFSIINQGTDPVAWSVTGMPPWMVVSPTNGVLDGSRSTNVMIFTNGFPSYPIGTTNFSLVCTSPGNTNTATATVSIHVNPADNYLSVTPTDEFASSGPIGGPFTPASRTYTLQASDMVSWYASNMPVWLTLSVTNGTMDFGDTTNVIVTVNSAATLLTGGLHTGRISFVNADNGARLDVSVSIRVGEEGFLVEDFNTHPFDLSFSTLTFTPSGNSYRTCITPAMAFPSPPVGAELPLGDDEYRLVQLTDSKGIPYPFSDTGSGVGLFFSSFWVGANGNVTLNPGFNTNAFYGADVEFFDHVRFAPLYADLNPAAGGRVLMNQLQDRFVVTWQDVPQFGTTSSNNVQLELFFDGRIAMTWLNIELPAPAPYPVAIVGLSRGAGVPANFVQTDLSAQHDCAVIARLLLPGVVREGDTGLEGILTLSAPLTNDMLVPLRSDNTNVAVVPPSVLIRAGQISVRFPITIFDDTLLDGTEFATITADFADRAPVSAMIEVDDNEATTLYVGVPGRASEGDGVLAGKGVVFLDFFGLPAGRDVAVALSSSNPDRVSVPPFVTVRAGTYVASFDITMIDDTRLNAADEKVDIVASVPNWGFADAVISVADNETYALGMSVISQVFENRGNIPVAGIVTLSGVASTPVTVLFSSDRSNAVFVPGSVVIPAGSSSNTFGLNVLNNQVLNDYDVVHITASASNFLSTTGVVAVLDDERPTPPVALDPATGASGVSSRPLLAWGVAPNSAASLVFDVYLGTNAAALSFLGTSSTNNYQVSSQLLNDTTYYWRVVARHDPYSATSAVWSFTVAGFDHFSVEPVPPLQLIGQPFPVGVTARDRFEQRLTVFSGTARLTNAVPSRTRSTISITEVDTGDIDRIEFQNSCDRPINISGWEIIAYDWTSWPDPKVVFTIPGPNVCNVGEVFQLRTFISRLAPGVYPSFIFPTNVSWNNNPSNNPVAVMLRDSFGNIVDFVCAGDAVASQISVPRTVPAAEWQGAAIPANVYSTLSYQRTGNLDHNNAGDWSVGAKSIGAANPGLAVPYTNYSSARMIAPDVVDFSGGTGTVSVTVFDEAYSLLLLAADSSGRTGKGARFDVLADGDVAVFVTAPDVATLHDPLPCRIVVTNSGASPATGVWMTNVPPPLSMFVSASSSQGACAATNGIVACDLGTLAPYSAASIVVNVLPIAPGIVTNIALVSRDGADGYLPNNVAGASTLVALPQITILDATNTEPDVATTMRFPVLLSVPSAVTTIVAFATFDGTATAGSDYIGATGTVVFPPGVTTQYVDVAVLPDTLSEYNETFYVSLSTPAGAQLIRRLATGTIVDNDGWPGVSVSDVTVMEGNGTNFAVFSVTLSTRSGRIVTMDYATADGTAIGGFDYVPSYGLVTFDPGVTVQTVTVPIIGDTIYEPMKTFGLRVENPANAVISKFQGICTILDDDMTELHHLAFDGTPQSALVNLPADFRGSARDVLDRVVTGFTGPVYFTAGEKEVTNTVASGNVAWNAPLGTSFHDSRTESIYLATDIGRAGQITSLALDVVSPPGQTLSNFTIRMKPFAGVRIPSTNWDTIGWTTNFQGSVSLLSTGWTTFVFRTPFLFDGVSNLLVDFSFNNSSYTKDGLCRSTTTSALRSLTAQSDSAFGDPLLWSNGVAGPFMSTNVPNVRFTIGNRIAVTPALTTDVSNGVWAATLFFGNGGTNVTVRAVDAAGHFATYTGWRIVEDTDGDGMPDWWEIAHGFNRFSPVDGAQDADGDGFTNYQEYLAGTDPFDRDSVLRISSLTSTNGNVAVTLPGLTGRSYILESSEALATPWVQRSVTIGPADGPLTLHDQSTNAFRFYRVRVE